MESLEICHYPRAKMPSSFFRAGLYKSIRITVIISTIIIKCLPGTRCLHILSHSFPFCMEPSFLQMRKHKLKEVKSLAQRNSAEK